MFYALLRKYRLDRAWHDNSGTFSDIKHEVFFSNNFEDRVNDVIVNGFSLRIVQVVKLSLVLCQE